MHKKTKAAYRSTNKKRDGIALQLLSSRLELATSMVTEPQEPTDEAIESESDEERDENAPSFAVTSSMLNAFTDLQYAAARTWKIAKLL